MLALRRLFTRLMIFGLPFAMVIAAALGFALYVGEVMPVRAIIAMQQQDNSIIYHPSFVDTIFAHKIQSAVERQPEVLLLGSSRVLQFRSELLGGQADRFLNAGGASWRLKEMTAYVDQLPDSVRPAVWVIGLDHYWLHPGFVETGQSENTDPSEVSLRDMLDGTQQVMRFVLDPPNAFSRRNLLSRSNPIRGGTALGLYAIQRGLGYRGDGSLQSGQYISNPQVRDREREYQQLKLSRREENFIAGDAVSADALAQIEAIIQTAQSRAGAVIGVIPSYSPQTYDELMNSGDFAYIPLAIEQLGALFADYDATLFDFSDASALGVDEMQMIDLVHPSELAAARMWQAMAQAEPDLLGAYTDLEELGQIIESAQDPFEIFPRGN